VIKKGSRVVDLDKEFQIGLIIPTTSRGRDWKSLDETDFFRILIPSFLKTYTREGKYQYHFYLGYDSDDDFYLSRLEETMKKFEELTEECHHLKMIQMSELGGKVGEIWNRLASRASEDGCQYLYQLGDDIRLVTEGWDRGFIKNLLNCDNFGVTGPRDTNQARSILTQSFVHHSHLQIFETYYPPKIENWYIDDWITEVYQSRPDDNFKVHNSGGPPRYKIRDDKSVFLKCLMESKKKLKEYLKDKPEIIYIGKLRRL